MGHGGQTVGVLGGGQLARMLALAGIPLGLQFVFVDPARDACAASLGRHLQGFSEDRLARLARLSDVVTYEFENVPEGSVAFVAERTTVFPSLAALSVARDRLCEKTLFAQLGIPVPPFMAVDSFPSLERAVETIGLPAVLKTRTMGYDGKGQVLLQGPEDLGTAWARLGDRPLLLERFVDFQRELSVIAARSVTGETVTYPVTENLHRGGILRMSRVRSEDPCETLAQEYARRLLDSLDYVGVLALELFQADDTLMANEMAPRVHNSGHWTIEGAETSQFENHLRAILGLPLGSTALRGHVAMVNLIGEVPEREAVLSIPGAHLHLYGKAPRPGRKLGHVTLRAESERDLDSGLERLLGLVRDYGDAYHAGRL